MNVKRQQTYVSNITIANFHISMLYDATWTPLRNIIFKAYEDSVVLISESGKVIKTTQIKEPIYLSVSNDNIIYVADRETGENQSMNNGISWIVIFFPIDGCQILHVTKVVTKKI